MCTHERRRRKRVSERRATGCLFLSVKEMALLSTEASLALASAKKRKSRRGSRHRSNGASKAADGAKKSKKKPRKNSKSKSKKKSKSKSRK